MRLSFLIIGLVCCTAGVAQPNTDLVKRSKSFHQALIAKSPELSSFLDDQLSYGHSNGWLETKAEMLDHLKTGVLEYLEITEDSVSVDAQDNIGYLRFVTNLKASLSGNTATFKLKVLEVWRKEHGQWVLYARQAIRAL